ncbi:Lipopolysaccharide export system protein LptC [anaerobic digester metagenome]|nr:LPS export ABC transporter periplasmic protein LptC [Lentimicrobiaceae bacterium]
MNNPAKIQLFLIKLSGVVLLLTGTTLFGCKNDPKEVERLNSADTIPSMYAREVEISESEAGRIKYTLTAPELIRFEEKAGAIIKFPQGFKVVFFDSLNPSVVRTEITALYGINNESKRTMEARDNVVVHNYQADETLNTELLIWNQNTHKVYSNTLVTITTPDKILYGDGMESDEKFYNWTILKPRGEMYVKDKD